LEIDFTLSPKPEEVDCIYKGLDEYNGKIIPELEKHCFALFIRNESGEVVGGLTGAIFTTSIQIKLLWLSETLRGKGIGSLLMAKVEMEARNRNISNIAVDTYTFQAPKFYEALGFLEVGRYKDYLVKGVDKIFYQNLL